MRNEELSKLKAEEALSGRGRRAGAASKYAPGDDHRENTLKTYCGEFADIAPIYFAAEILIGDRTERVITKEKAWIAINKFILETIEQGQYDNLLRLHKILKMVSEHKRTKKREIDPIRLRMVFINDWLMLRRASDPGRWPEVSKGEILKTCRKNFAKEFEKIEDQDAYKFMRALGLPKQPDASGQVSMGRVLLGDKLFDELFCKDIGGK